MDGLLDARASQIGRDFTGYRNHCYRVFNFCVALAPAASDSLDKIAVATAFHDIGIWTRGSFDYLAPSIQAAAAHLQSTGRQEWVPEVSRMILEHHKILAFRTNPAWLVEPFRRADWIDVSLGLRRFSLPHGLIRNAFQTWPDAGFHRRLAWLAFERLKTHPASPLPMLRL